MQYKALLLLIGTLFGIGSLSAQEDFKSWVKKKEGFKIEPFVMLQLWGTYTDGQEVLNEETGQYELVDNRTNFLIRRGRLGFRAQPYERLKFVLVGSFDLIGRDVNAGIVGGFNNGSVPNFAVWDAFGQWKVRKEGESLYLTAGYFRPQLSRESITSGWSVNSMEKSMSQNYIRRHLTGIGPGRAAGMNIGGLWLREDQKLGFNYNFGIFNPVYLDNFGNSGGTPFSPLLVGRGVLYIGDPEMTRYKLGYDINYFNERRGLSIGLSGSWQGETPAFQNSTAVQADILFNWGSLNFDADWNFMWRDGIQHEEARAFTYFAHTGHLRAGYNLVVGKRFFIEPTFMMMQFNGPLEAQEQGDALLVRSFTGTDYTYDAGVNWYINKKHFKITVHYTWREGDPGEAVPGAIVNQYFNQSGVGAIRRGNWLGVGCNLIF